MGLCDSLKNLSAIIGAQGDENSLLEPLLASYGIDAALIDYDAHSRQVVLALLIHGKPSYIPLATGRRYSRSEIAQLIAGKGPAAIAASPPTSPDPPPPAA